MEDILLPDFLTNPEQFSCQKIGYASLLLLVSLSILISGRDILGSEGI